MPRNSFRVFHEKFCGRVRSSLPTPPYVSHAISSKIENGVAPLQLHPPSDARVSRNHYRSPGQGNRTVWYEHRAGARRWWVSGSKPSWWGAGGTNVNKQGGVHMRGLESGELEGATVQALARSATATIIPRVRGDYGRERLYEAVRALAGRVRRVEVFVTRVAACKNSQESEGREGKRWKRGTHRGQRYVSGATKDRPLRS